MQASQTFKKRFSNFRKVVHQISSGVTRNRNENLKTRILIYSIGGWTGEGDIHLSAHSISTLGHLIKKLIHRRGPMLPHCTFG